MKKEWNVTVVTTEKTLSAIRNVTRGNNLALKAICSVRGMSVIKSISYQLHFVIILFTLHRMQ